MKTPLPCWALIATFLLTVVSVPLLQTLVEVGRGERPQVGELFACAPSQANLRAFERSLEASSVVAQAVRPWLQAARFLWLREAGEKALAGSGGWLFYAPGVSALTQRPRRGDTSAREAVAAAVDFRNQLAARGVRLLLVPVPNKESVYPGRLAPQAGSGGFVGEETRRFFALSREAGLEVVDLFEAFRAARARPGEPLYLAQDSHWTPAGLQVAAEAVAGRLLALGWVARGAAEFESSSVFMQRHGDLVRMMQSPVVEAWLFPEVVIPERLVCAEAGAASPVLVLGDSFLRIFELDAPWQAGFVSHLARALALPVDSIINDGGASTLVRQELARRPQRLEGKRVVVWMFVERDLRLGLDGWQRVQLPARCVSASPDGG
jgi:hypothetical protein